MPKFLLVEGVPGHPVTDPRNPAASPARYLGWNPKPGRVEDPAHILDHYDQAQQIVQDHPDIRAAIKGCRLTLIKETVAKNFDGARKDLGKGGIK